MLTLKTKEFQDVCKTINAALPDSINKEKPSVVELVVKDSNLYLNVTNNEYFVGIKYVLEEPEEFRAVVDAKRFFGLISNISTECFDMSIQDKSLLIKTGKSKYNFPLVFENENLMQLKRIRLSNVTVEMDISEDILNSIYSVNRHYWTSYSNNLPENDVRNFYHITQEGAFNFFRGSCLNSFTLEKGVELILNDRIVKLFNLFNSGVHFQFGTDGDASYSETKVIFEAANIYLAAVIKEDAAIINKIHGPANASRELIREKYPVNIVVPVKSFLSAVTRFLMFTKGTKKGEQQARMSVTRDEISFTDDFGCEEYVPITSDGYVAEPYSFYINIGEVKTVLESLTNEYFTFNCGNSRCVVVTDANINYLIPECKG